MDNQITRIKDLNKSMLNSKVKVKGKLVDTKKTSGPYLLFLEEDNSQIVCVTYDTPNFELGDYVEVVGFLQMSYNGLQIKAQSMEKKGSEKVELDFDGFLIKNEVLDKLKPQFIQAAKLIKEAIIKQRPILIKHHNDADGYSGALALEEAIVDALPDNSFLKWNLFSRNPSTTPFYDYFDATIDISQAISKEERFGKKNPIIIIVDNGSTESDEFAVKLIKEFGFEILVIDHHTPIDNKKIDIHINPHLVGGGSNITAGMMCVELAKMINPNFKSYHYACISAIGDRSNVQDYFDLTEIPINDLKRIAICMDFQAKFLRRMEARGLMQELINLDKSHLDIIFSEIDKRLKRQVNLISMNLEKEKFSNSINFLSLDYKKVRIYDDFPSIGTNAGLLINEFGDKNSVCVVYDAGIVVTRSTKNDFDFNDILKELKKNPQYGLEGGGHKKAGTVTFINMYTEEILKKIRDYVFSLQA